MKIASRLLVVDPDPKVVATLDRYLEKFEVIHIANPEDLAQAFDEYRPQAVIYNIRPKQQAPIGIEHITVPCIECSLPSYLWLVEDLDIAGYLTKPVLSQQLINAIEQFDKLEQILVIDDDRGFVQLIERIIKANRTNAHIQRAYTGYEGLELMRQTHPDLVLLDLDMPDKGGHYVLDVMKETASLRDIPVILLTATSTADEAVEQLSDTLTIRWPKKLYTAQVLRGLQIAVNMLELPSLFTE